MQSTTIPIPTAALQELTVFSHQNGLTNPWNTFYEEAMKKIVGTGSSTGSSAGPQNRTRVRAAAGSGTRRPGRPPGATRPTRVARTAATASKANTGDLIAKVAEHPGITMTQLSAEFPNVRPNILGRLLSQATKATRTRNSALIKQGDGYHLAPGFQQPVSSIAA